MMNKVASPFGTLLLVFVHCNLLSFLVGLLGVNSFLQQMFVQASSVACDFDCVELDSGDYVNTNTNVLQ